MISRWICDLTLVKWMLILYVIEKKSPLRTEVVTRLWDLSYY